MSKVHWEIIEAFSSPHEYCRFQHWLGLQVEKGYATAIVVDTFSGRLPLVSEKHYQCDDGRVWVLSAPDFPFRGSWQPLTDQLNTVRWETIKGFNSPDEYKQFENAFVRLKHFRAVATRFDKLKRNYQGIIAMACAIMWLPM